jgi:type IV secretion system protein TrbC
MKTQHLLRLATMAIVLSVSANCFAAGSSAGMPWEGPLEMITSSMTGNTAKFIGVLAITLVGLTMAFSEGGGIMKKMLNVVMGLCIAFSASTFFLSFFGYGSGLGF